MERVYTYAALKAYSTRESDKNDKPLSLLFQMFLVALSFAYFSKALSGSYMKSTITQLERRFDIPSYLIGIIDGSFEIGKSHIICRAHLIMLLNFSRLQKSIF